MLSTSRVAVAVVGAFALAASTGCASSPPPPPATAAATPAESGASPSTAAPAPPPSSTHVHIDSDNPTLPLTLYRVEFELSGHGYRRSPTSGVGSVRDGDDRSSEVVDLHATAYRAVCLAPCDLDVQGGPAQPFFLGGEGIKPSSNFRLDPRLGSVRIKAAPKSIAYTHGGTALATTGAVALFMGSVFFFPGLAFRSPGMTEGGGAALGVGSALLGGGIAALLVGKTTYTLEAWRF